MENAEKYRIDDIIKNLNVLAAEIARRNGMPSPFLENHPKRITRRYVEGEFEKVDDKCGEWASRLGELTRQLSKQCSKEPGEGE